jgi:hypothetical protein
MDRRTERRIAAASRELLQKERRISDILRLPTIPRLSLLDEASATYVTGGDRIHLHQEDEQGGQPKADPPPVRGPAVAGSHSGGTQPSDEQSTMDPTSNSRGGGWWRRRTS